MAPIGAAAKVMDPLAPAQEEPQLVGYSVSGMKPEQWDALRKSDPVLFQKAREAQATYAETLAQGGRVIVSRSAGLSGAPMLLLVPPGFSAKKPVTLQTHFHGDGGSITNSNGIAGRIMELQQADPQRLFLLPETKRMNDWSNVTNLLSTQNDALAFAGASERAENQFVVSAHSGGGHGVMYAMAADLKASDGSRKLRMTRLELLDCIHYNKHDRGIEQTIVKWAKEHTGEVASVLTVHGTMGDASDWASIKNAFGVDKCTHVDITPALARSLVPPQDLRPGETDRSDVKHLMPRWAPSATHSLALGHYLGGTNGLSPTAAVTPPAPARAPSTTAQARQPIAPARDRPVVQASGGTSDAQTFDDYVGLLEKNGGRLDPERPTVLGIRKLKDGGDPSYALDYHDSFVVLSPDHTFKVFVGSTYPGQRGLSKPGEKIDARHDMSRGMGMMRPGNYEVTRSMVVLPEKGGSAMDVAAWRDTNRDGKFSAEERKASEERGDLMWMVLFHPGANDAAPRSIGCQNLRPKDWGEFCRRVGNQGFSYTLIETREGEAPVVARTAAPAASAPIAAPPRAVTAAPVAAAPASSAPASPLTVTPKQKGFGDEVRALYEANTTASFTVNTMKSYFGRGDDGRVVGSWAGLRKAFDRYIVKTDPVTHQPITFLGRPISGGVNAYMLPLLKAAEAQILAAGVKWQPKASTILGYGFRGMKIGGVESTSILSSHSAGLSLDIDAGNNGAHYDGGATNRGDIPDVIVKAMVKAGFVWGGVRREGFNELGDDPMHFQQSLHPDDARYQAIMAESETARAYRDALEQAKLLPPLPSIGG